MKYCETLTPGYYTKRLIVNDKIIVDRVYYFTGTTKGNKWIELLCGNPKWCGLMPSAIRKDEMSIGDVIFHSENPTNFKLKI